MLLRYFETNSSSISVDSIPISDYSSTYGCITVLRQDAVLFQDTLRNNLTMYQEIEDEKLLSLLSRLGLEKYANVDSLDGIAAENGSNLSGGERKRICLARALLRKREILILDEPLANLDAEIAEKIEDLLLSIEEKTVIVVSHQFSEEKLLAFDHVLDFAKF